VTPFILVCSSYSWYGTCLSTLAINITEQQYLMEVTLLKWVTAKSFLKQTKTTKTKIVFRLCYPVN